jgi:recombination protein RecT
MTQDLAKVDKSHAGQLRALLEQSKREIEIALPRSIMAPERMLRIAMTEARKNPELLECDKFSFLGSVIQAAQLGLEPGSTLGQCYLIPFNNHKKGIKEVQFMMGYQGMLTLISRTSNAPIIMPRAVFEGDEFIYSYGLNPELKHVPLQRPDPKEKLLYIYVVATFADGRKEFDVMTRPEIDHIRSRSKAKSFSPWGSDFDAMAKKTGIRRLCKYLPKSSELQRALALDDLADRDESQRHEEIFVSNETPVFTKKEQVEGKMKSDDPEGFENFCG